MQMKTTILKVVSIVVNIVTVRDICTGAGTWFWYDELDFDIKVGMFIKAPTDKYGTWIRPYCKLNGLDVFNLRKRLGK